MKPQFFCGFNFEVSMKLCYIDITAETKELFKAFDNCLAKVKGNIYCEDFAKEKIRHSMQVVGAGNYIIKNEKIFQNRSSDYLKLAKLVNLFHDIGRFKEVELLNENPTSKHDHSYYSYSILKELGYSDFRLLLPIKQHGHLADALENDKEFNLINDEKLKKEIRELYGLVKDADKIANLYLLKYDLQVFKDLFFTSLSDEAKYAPVSKVVLETMQSQNLVKKNDCFSFADRLVQILCFVFEIYYKPSFDFIKKNKLLDNLFVDLKEYCPDKDMVEYIRNFILSSMDIRYKKLL